MQCLQPVHSAENPCQVLGKVQDGWGLGGLKVGRGGELAPASPLNRGAELGTVPGVRLGGCAMEVHQSAG